VRTARGIVTRPREVTIAVQSGLIAVIDRTSSLGSIPVAVGQTSPS
jgi:hypothetical protein